MLFWFRIPLAGFEVSTYGRFSDVHRGVLAFDMARLDEMVQSRDCASKDLETSDFVVGQIWGRVGPKFLLLDQVRGRMDFPATVKSVRQ
jgi:phage terminase large subunit-like protein